MAKQENPEPVAPHELSTQTGAAPTPEQEKKAKADAEAMKIVGKEAPEPSIQLYMWQKKRLFHEKGLDEVWATIAKAVGADKPPENWIPEGGEPLAPPPGTGTHAQPIK